GVPALKHEPLVTRFSPRVRNGRVTSASASPSHNADTASLSRSEAAYRTTGKEWARVHSLRMEYDAASRPSRLTFHILPAEACASPTTGWFLAGRLSPFRTTRRIQTRGRQRCIFRNASNGPQTREWRVLHSERS